MNMRAITPIIALLSLGFATSNCSAQAGATASATASESFYAVSNVATDKAPGSLIRTTDYNASRLTGSANSRIMYLSVNANGQTVATTAAVAVPKGTAPEGGWPVVAWAHGTVGVGKSCAPSMTDNLSKYGPFIQGLIDRGYAVVATDYSGLGTTGRHFYSHRESNARDTIESVRAATTAYPSLSKSFVVMGHSQGGLAAIGVAETVAALSIAPLQYKGAIAIAPGTGTVQQYFKAMERNGTSDPTTLAYMLYYAATLKLSNPGIPYSDILSSDAVSLMPAAESQCLDELRSTLKSTPNLPKYFVKSSWGSHQALASYSQANHAGQTKATGPLFIAWGTSDPAISRASLDTFVSASCRLGSTVQFTKYAGANHSTVLADAKPDMLAWMAQQFSGTYKAPECGT